MAEKTTPLPVEQQNIKPSFLQKLAGYLIDMSLIFLLYWGLYTICMNTPISSGFDYYHYQIIEIQDAYKLETGYGEKVTITPENASEYASYYKHKDVDDTEYVVVNVKDVSETVTKAYVDKLNGDNAYQGYVFNRRLVLYGINVLAGSVATAILLLLVPLLNKNRATLGMLASNQQLFSVRFESRARWYHILIRYLFIFIFEIAIPFMFMELYVFLLLPTLYLIISSLNKKGMTLHDLVSQVRVIDSRSYTPLVEEKDEVTEQKEE